MMPPWARRRMVVLLAFAIVIPLFFAARLPEQRQADNDVAAAGLAFEVTPYAAPQGAEERPIRNVHPSLTHIDAWISSVGAGAALADLDGDGAFNDLCLVDPRADGITVMPADPADLRYTPFSLVSDSETSGTVASMGCLAGDVTEDGHVDLVVYFWGRPPLAYVRVESSQLDSSAFTPVDIASSTERWYTNAATFADVDGDARVDLIIGNYFPDGARILDASDDEPQTMQHGMSRAFNGGRNRILLASPSTGDGEPLFVDSGVQLPQEILTGWTLAVGAADLDGDLLPEIYFGNDFGPDRLLHNRSRIGEVELVPLVGERGAGTAKSKVLGFDSFKGMGIDFGDLNGDGRLDMYVSNIASEFALEESHFAWTSSGDPTAMSHGIAPYVDQSEELGLARGGWGWDTRLVDFDNDGVLEAVQATGFIAGSINRWPELHELAMGNDELLAAPGSWPRFSTGDDVSGDQPNRLLVRHEGRYIDVAEQVDLGQSVVTRGIAVADIDLDGDPDMVWANQWSDSWLVRNQSATGDFIGFRILRGHGPSVVHRGLVSVPAAVDVVGAEVVVSGGDGRQWRAQVDGGSGHSGKRAPHVLFGLGTADGPLTVTVRWRDGDGLHTQEYELDEGWHTVVLGSEPP